MRQRSIDWLEDAQRMAILPAEEAAELAGLRAYRTVVASRLDLGAARDELA